jgi:TonB family protein
MFVTEDGKPIAWDIKQSSGDLVYDGEILRIARRTEFYPAILAGVARAVWVELPFRLARPQQVPR